MLPLSLILNVRIRFLFGSINELTSNYIVMKPDAIPSLSSSGRQELADYEFYLREQRDISPVTVRNYLSDLRSFITWYENKSPSSVKVGFERRVGSTLD